MPPGTALVFKRYRVRSETWEHEHCLFCWTKFMDPEFSEAHRRLIEKHDVLTEGYTTTDEHPQGAGHWVCPQCVGDFAKEFGLRVEGGPAGVSG